MGVATETVVDRDVRRTWQIATGSLRIGGRHWDKTLAEIVAEAARGLGVIEPVAADFYKLADLRRGQLLRRPPGHRRRLPACSRPW